MLSLLLIAALAVQTPTSAKPDTSAQHHRKPTTSRSSEATPRDTNRAAAVGRAAFHDRMRELWSDHIAYTRNFIVSATAALPDTAEVAQRLLRNQDEIGDAIKPYYGDAAGGQLASLLRNHIQLAAKTLMAAKGNNTAMQSGMTARDSSRTYVSGRMGSDSSMSRTDTVKLRTGSQYPANPTAAGRANADTSKAGRATAGRMTDTTKSKLPNPNSNPSSPTRTDSTSQTGQYTSGQYAQAQTQQSQNSVDSTALNQAIAELRANGDSIAALLSSANPRGFAKTTLSGAIQMHLNLLLQEATAQIKKDWSGSISAYDESQRQAMQMADMLSDGIMKQFPSRFNNKVTTVSSR
jgi:hypothetical protein